MACAFLDALVRCAARHASDVSATITIPTGCSKTNAASEFADKNLKGCTVADVLADPQRFDGEVLADPIEGVAYGERRRRCCCGETTAHRGSNRLRMAACPTRCI